MLMADPFKADWTIDGRAVQLRWDEAALSWTLRRGDREWRTATPGPGSLACYRTSEIVLSLADAARRETRPFRNGALDGVTCALSGFPGLPVGADLRLTLGVAVELATGELVSWLDGDEAGVAFQRANWPGAVIRDPAHPGETIIPFCQGARVPGNWPHAVQERYHMCHTRGLYMPWWAERRGDAGYIAIIESDADGGCHFHHPADGPTLVEPFWRDTLGRVGYRRVIRYAFFDRCDHVSLCKHYRNHVRRRGPFVTLAQKIEAAPKVARLLGVPVVHCGIANHIDPSSSRYNKEDPARNHSCTPFRARAEQVRELRRMGLERAYLHLDGWGRCGYDNEHPDTLPPNAEAGGWEGMRELADTCAHAGWLFALHDQYRDYFHRAPSFSFDNAIREIDGRNPFNDMWAGGAQSVLCAAMAPALVLRNHLDLARNGVRVDGTYLDVFSIHAGDQCFNPAHRMTRRECLNHWARCFGIIRDLEGIVSSEEPTDWAMPHLHLVHHGPHATAPWQVGSPAQLPCLPLHALVYHDVLITPWPAARRAQDYPWGGVPADHSVEAFAALHGGMPYLPLKPWPAPEELARIRRLCDLQNSVALSEMVHHEFLDETGARQRTTFADGTAVTADMATGEWNAVRQ